MCVGISQPIWHISGNFVLGWIYDVVKLITTYFISLKGIRLFTLLNWHSQSGVATLSNNFKKKKFDWKTAAKTKEQQFKKENIEKWGKN